MTPPPVKQLSSPSRPPRITTFLEAACGRCIPKMCALRPSLPACQPELACSMGCMDRRCSRRSGARRTHMTAPCSEAPRSVWPVCRLRPLRRLAPWLHRASWLHRGSNASQQEKALEVGQAPSRVGTPASIGACTTLHQQLESSLGRRAAYHACCGVVWLMAARGHLKEQIPGSCRTVITSAGRDRAMWHVRRALQPARWSADNWQLGLHWTTLGGGYASGVRGCTCLPAWVVGCLGGFALGCEALLAGSVVRGQCIAASGWACTAWRLRAAQ